MTNFDYYGIFLDDESKKILLSACPLNEIKGWTIICDHVTLIHHSADSYAIVPFLDMFLGSKVTFNVLGWGKSENALALIVDVPSMNKVSHITIAVAPGKKPVESNYIKDWHYQPLNVAVKGYLDVRLKRH